MNNRGKVLQYFQRNARQFDLLYDNRAGLSGLIQRVLWGPFYRRFALTMARCGDVAGKQVLDVGCGSGRYTVALAERGAQVVGIDFADNMLTLARELAEQRRVGGRCRFICADFLTFDFDQVFDITLAIGLFDYVADPVVFLRKIHTLTRDMVILTFPRPDTWRAPQRRLRYWLKGCPIYFHTQAGMAAYLSEARYEEWQFIGSWAVAFPRRARQQGQLLDGGPGTVSEPKTRVLENPHG